MRRGGDDWRFKETVDYADHNPTGGGGVYESGKAVRPYIPPLGEGR